MKLNCKYKFLKSLSVIWMLKEKSSGEFPRRLRKKHAGMLSPGLGGRLRAVSRRRGRQSHGGVKKVLKASFNKW